MAQIWSSFRGEDARLRSGNFFALAIAGLDVRESVTLWSCRYDGAWPSAANFDRSWGNAWGLRPIIEAETFCFPGNRKERSTSSTGLASENNEEIEVAGVDVSAVADKRLSEVESGEVPGDMQSTTCDSGRAGGILDGGILRDDKSRLASEVGRVGATRYDVGSGSVFVGSILP